MTSLFKKWTSSPTDLECDFILVEDAVNSHLHKQYVRIEYITDKVLKILRNKRDTTRVGDITLLLSDIDNEHKHFLDLYVDDIIYLFTSYDVIRKGVPSLNLLNFNWICNWLVSDISISSSSSSSSSDSSHKIIQNRLSSLQNSWYYFRFHPFEFMNNPVDSITGVTASILSKGIMESQKIYFRLSSKVPGNIVIVIPNNKGNIYLPIECSSDFLVANSLSPFVVKQNEGTIYQYHFKSLSSIIDFIKFHVILPK